MLSAPLKAKLADPAYLDLHLVAAGVVRGLGNLPWYDSYFLRDWTAAKEYLAQVRPDALPGFENAFAVLQPPAGFAPLKLENLLGRERLGELAEIVRSLPPDLLECHEQERFGRTVVHDHPEFSRLQEELRPRMGELLGEELESGYNFLSLYGPHGRCPMHMDEPVSMYTLDVCIDRDGDWPIHFSEIVDWPGRDAAQDGWPDNVRGELAFTPFVIRENEAVLFCGSSQWHYRDPMPGGGACSLLFLHYYPARARGLVDPQDWPETLALPELQPLCDLLAELPRG